MLYVDLADATAARSACANMDTVFHTAAKVGIWGKREDFKNANVIGTQSIINGCRDFLVPKLVYTSTPSVVFNNQNLAGADESLPYGMSTAYRVNPRTSAMAGSRSARILSVR